MCQVKELTNAAVGQLGTMAEQVLGMTCHIRSGSLHHSTVTARCQLGTMAEQVLGMAWHIRIGSLHHSTVTARCWLGAMMAPLNRAAMMTPTPAVAGTSPPSDRSR